MGKEGKLNYSVGLDVSSLHVHGGGGYIEI